MASILRSNPYAWYAASVNGKKRGEENFIRWKENDVYNQMSQSKHSLLHLLDVKRFGCTTIDAIFGFQAMCQFQRLHHTNAYNLILKDCQVDLRTVTEKYEIKHTMTWSIDFIQRESNEREREKSKWAKKRAQNAYQCFRCHYNAGGEAKVTINHCQNFFDFFLFRFAIRFTHINNMTIPFRELCHRTVFAPSFDW